MREVAKRAIFFKGGSVPWRWTKHIFTGSQADAITGLARRGFDAATARSLTLRHGTGISWVEALIDENPDWAQRIHPDAPYLRAEVVLSVRDEMARTAEDVVRRRMPLNLLVPPGEWLAEVKALMTAAVAA